MAQEASSELQSLVLSSILKSTYLYSKVNKLLKLEFFSNLNYRIILSKVIYHYNKYGNVPTCKALLNYLDNVTEVPNTVELKSACIELFAMQGDESEEYIIDQITSFVRSNNIKNAIVKYLPKIEKSNDSNSLINELGNALSESIEIDCTQGSELLLSDSEALAESRRLAVGSEEGGSGIIQSKFDQVNRALMFGGYKYGDLVAIVAPPGSGKTSILVNEGVAAAQQQFQVLHLFIGDMNNYDGWIRYMSCICKVSQRDLVNMTLEQQQNFIASHNFVGMASHITVKDYPAESFTADQLIKDIREIQNRQNRKYDLIIVDYPDNLISEGDNMYQSGGTIYNKLSAFAYKNKSAVLVACQPKIAYYSSEVIPLEGCAESSKKQQNIDMMISLGKPYRDFEYLTAFIPKCRRGEVGGKFRIKTNFEFMSATVVSEIEYQNALQNYLGRNPE